MRLSGSVLSPDVRRSRDVSPGEDGVIMEEAERDGMSPEEMDKIQAII